MQGPDPHDMFGCSVPFSLWVGCLFVATLSYYTTDYMRQGQDASEKRTERYVYDPNAGEQYSLCRRFVHLYNIWGLSHLHDCPYTARTCSDKPARPQKGLCPTLRKAH